MSGSAARAEEPAVPAPFDIAGASPRRLASALHAAYNAHDAKAAAALYGAEGRHVEIATGSERRGADDVEAGLSALLLAFPDLRWERRSLIADDRGAAIAYAMTGTLQARLGPFEPRSQPLSLRGVHVLLAGEHGIALCEDYWDAASFARQMRA